MKHKTKVIYTDNPEMDGLVVMNDPRLPTPEELAQNENTKKVTLELTTDSIRAFQKYATAHQAPYQVMIRKLVDSYAKNMLIPQ